MNDRDDILDEVVAWCRGVLRDLAAVTAERDAARAEVVEWQSICDQWQARVEHAIISASRLRGALTQVRRMVEGDAYRAQITAVIDDALAQEEDA